MILAFEFSTRATHGVLENILSHIVKNAGFALDLRRNGNILTLFLNSDEETLLEFSNTLSNRLPLSIFVQSFNVQVVDAPFGEPVKVELCELFLPFTPGMVSSVTDEKNSLFYNPFTPCEIGLDLESNGILSFTCKDEVFTCKEGDFKTLFNKAALALCDGNSLHVSSATGPWVIKALKYSHLDTNDAIVMPTDLSVVEKMVVIKPKEIEALASLEKPVLRLSLNAVFESKQIITEKFINMRMADDLILLLLMRELYALGVEFVVMKSGHNGDCHLVYEGGRTRSLFHVNVLENGQCIPVKGDMYIPKNMPKVLEPFVAPSAKQAVSVLKENGLLKNRVACVCLSRKYKDEFMVYSDTNGLVDLMYFDFANSGKEIMDEICQSTTGKKLVDNFLAKYPKEFKSFCDLDLSSFPKSLYTILGAAGVLFGFGDTVENGAGKLLDNAALFSGLKGPRIDFLLKGNTLRAQIDALRLLRSGMSFSLADTDAQTLSYGYVDSLGYFISDSLDRIQDEFKTTHVAFCGSLFGDRRLAEAASRHAKVTHTVCFNNEFPLEY
jgi:hypothetical protein